MSADTTTPSSRAVDASFFEATRVDKPWGHEIVFAAGEAGYVGKLITVHAGHALSLQYHEHKIETISVVSGVASFDSGPDPDSLTSVVMGPGQTVHLPAGVVHRMTALSELTFVEASTAAPGWRDDVVRLEDRYGRTGTRAP
jgi:mannose-6-phosphate isomerase-like protein (cupin superfamily)